MVLLRAQVLYGFLACTDPFKLPAERKFPWRHRANKRGISNASSIYCETKAQLEQVRDVMLEGIRDKMDLIASPSSKFARKARQEMQKRKETVPAHLEPVLERMGERDAGYVEIIVPQQRRK